MKSSLISIEKMLRNANCLYKKNKIEDAKLLYMDVLMHEPKNYEALKILGYITVMQGVHEESVKYFKDFVDLSKTDVLVWKSFFDSLSKCDPVKYSDLFYEYLEKYIKLFEKRPDMISDVAIMLYNAKSYKYSLDVFEKSISIKSNNMSFLNPECFYDFMYMAEIYKIYDKPSSSVKALKLGLMVDPNKQGVMSQIIRHKHLACEWDQYYENNKYVIDLVTSNKQIELPFAFLNITASGVEQLVCANNYKPKTIRFSGKKKVVENSKIRVGYVSADYYHHATTILAEKLFEFHDKDIFEIIGFDLLNKQDETTLKLKENFDEFYDVSILDDKKIAKKIQSLNIDILVDLKGYTRDSRPNVFAFHPAPIQVSYLGYPGTMGSNFMEYIIADSVVIPRGYEGFYGEKIVRLPYSYQINNSDKEFSKSKTQKYEHGLPDDVFVFCSFNNNYKITPYAFEVWMNILQLAEKSVLWLLKDSDDAERNLRIEAESYGIDPNRIIFAPRIGYSDHIERHAHADLFLDTLPINAHTTASDSLWAGVPVLTCPGESFASRVAASLLNAVGLNDLIVNSYDEYLKLAVEIANNKARLDEFKSALSKDKIKRHLFNPLETTRHIEVAYLEMYRRHMRGLSPDHIDVAP